MFKGQLYSPLIVHTTPEHEELKAIAQKCTTRYHIHHYLGFARTQWNLFQKEHPHRVKPLLYIYQVLLTGIYLMQIGKIEANLLQLNEEFKLPYIPELIQLKLSGLEKGILEDVNLVFHQQEYNRLCYELKQASLSSHLPETPNCQTDLNDLLVRARLVYNQ